MVEQEGTDSPKWMISEQLKRLVLSWGCRIRVFMPVWEWGKGRSEMGRKVKERLSESLQTT